MKHLTKKEVQKLFPQAKYSGKTSTWYFEGKVLSPQKVAKKIKTIKATTDFVNNVNTIVNKITIAKNAFIYSFKRISNTSAENIIILHALRQKENPTKKDFQLMKALQFAI